MTRTCVAWQGALSMVAVIALIGCASGPSLSPTWSADADPAGELAIGTPYTLVVMDPAVASTEHENLALRLPGMQVAVGVRQIQDAHPEPRAVVAVFALPPGSADHAQVVDALVASVIALNAFYEPKVESVAGHAVTYLVSASTGDVAPVAIFRLGDNVYEVRGWSVDAAILQSLIEANS